MIILIFISLIISIKSQSFDYNIAFCESFKGRAIYENYELGSIGSCESNIWPKGEDVLCLVDPDNIQQPLEYTCQDYEEIYARFFANQNWVTTTPFSSEHVVSTPQWSIPTLSLVTSTPAVKLVPTAQWSIPTATDVTSTPTVKLVSTIHPIDLVFHSTTVKTTSKSSIVTTPPFPVRSDCQDVHVTKKDDQLLRLELSKTNEFLFKTESRLQDCMKNCKKENKNETDCSAIKLGNISNLDDFLTFLICQQAGIYIGSSITLSSYICDRGLASYCARKYNIKQKYALKLIFPTIICLIQIVLRKRNKDSQLAAFLSTLKNAFKSDEKMTPSKSQKRKGSLTSMHSLNLRPKPFDCNNLKQSKSDTVFGSPYHGKIRPNFYSRTTATRHNSLPETLNKIKVQNRKNSIVSIPMESVDCW